MNHTTNHTKQELLQLIQDPQHCAARERVTVKAKILFDYLRPPERPAARFEDWAEVCNPRPGDRLVFRDVDGDLALAQPYAEMFVLSAARHFGGAVALILMAETCYEPTIGVPDHLNDALARFRPLVMAGRLPSPVLLHEFLEVEEAVTDWFDGHLRRHRMVAGRDYAMLPDDGDDGSTNAGSPNASVGPVRLTPMIAARIAASTPTLRGRKMKACLVEPGVKPLDLADNALELLELLFTPPTRGLSSL